MPNPDLTAIHSLGPLHSEHGYSPAGRWQSLGFAPGATPNWAVAPALASQFTRVVT